MLWRIGLAALGNLSWSTMGGDAGGWLAIMMNVLHPVYVDITLLLRGTPGVDRYGRPPGALPARPSSVTVPA